MRRTVSSTNTPNTGRRGLSKLLKTPGRLVDYAAMTPHKLPADTTKLPRPRKPR